MGYNNLHNVLPDPVATDKEPKNIKNEQQENCFWTLKSNLALLSAISNSSIDVSAIPFPLGTL